MVHKYEVHYNAQSFALPSIFSKAICFGTEMMASKCFRSFQSEASTIQYIKSIWLNQDYLNSWCLMKKRGFEMNEVDGVSETSSFGMINYFFTITANDLCIFDTVVEGLATSYRMASIMTFNSKISQRYTNLEYIDLNDPDTHVNSSQFCMLTDLESTRIAIVFSDVEMKPYIKQVDNISPNQLPYVSHKSRQMVQYIEPLILSPHKLCVREAFAESCLI